MEINLDSYIKKKTEEQRMLLNILRTLKDTDINNVDIYVSRPASGGIVIGLMYENKFIHFDGYRFKYYDTDDFRKYNPTVSTELFKTPAECYERCKSLTEHNYFFYQQLKGVDKEINIIHQLEDHVIDVLESINMILNKIIYKGD